MSAGKTDSPRACITDQYRKNFVHHVFKRGVSEVALW